MRGAPPLMLFRVVAGNPRAWDKFRAGSLLDPGPLSLREREIVIDRTCALTCLRIRMGRACRHICQSRRAERRADPGDGAATAPTAPCWSASEQALIAAVDALHHRATLSDAEFAALSSHYDDAKIFEIILLCGFYRTVSYFANGLDLPLEATAARFPVAGAN